MNLVELIPLVRSARTAREFGAIVLANVDPRQKHRIALAARDALGRTWSDTTVRYYLAPVVHGHAIQAPPRGPTPPRASASRPEPTRDFPPAIAGPEALVEAAWSHPAPTDSERTVVVQTLVRMVYLNGGSTNFARGWLGALRGRLAACGRDVTPQELSWFRSQVQDDPMVFSRVPGVDLGVLAALEDRFLK